MKDEGKGMMISISKTICVPIEHVNDIMVTAIEGGINYWCGKVEILYDTVPEMNVARVKYASDVIGYGGSLRLYDVESFDTWVLTPENFRAGLQEFVKMNSLTEIDPGMIDAGDADTIVQLAIFNDITFG
jgi:hypothetical protein